MNYNINIIFSCCCSLYELYYTLHIHICTYIHTHMYMQCQSVPDKTTYSTINKLIYLWFILLLFIFKQMICSKPYIAYICANWICLSSGIFIIFKLVIWIIFLWKTSIWSLFVLSNCSVYLNLKIISIKIKVAIYHALSLLQQSIYLAIDDYLLI